MMGKRLVTYPFENRSGIKLRGNAIRTIKQHCFVPLDTSVGGDAPKDVIKMYQYDGKCRKNSLKTWPTYIAKIGHKWYPNESVTEQLISEIGKIIGLNIADSELVQIEGIARFCSKHFHSKKQVLNHGAEILSRYMNEDDPQWIDDLDKKKEIKAFINVQDIFSAFKSVFKKNSESLIYSFVDMLLFDCLVGNNDRHYYNWGIIAHIEGKHQPFFAPVYDTARALWWNSSDNFVLSLHQNNDRKNMRIENYVKKSVPKISIPQNEQCNHFDLVQFLKNKNYITPKQTEIWLNEIQISNIYELIENKFCKLMIPERRELIKYTLKLRFKRLIQILN